MSEIDRRPRRISLDKEYSDNDDDDKHVDSDEDDGRELLAKRCSFIMNFDSCRIMAVCSHVLTHCKQYHFVRRRSRGLPTTTGKGTGRAGNKAPKAKDNRKVIKAGSKVSLEPSQCATKSQDLSGYELERGRNVERNEAMMLQLGILLPVANEGDCITKPPTKNRVEGTKSVKGRGPETASAPSLQSPTRQQSRLNQEPILVAWGGELHCSNPLLPSTHYVYWPLGSMGVTSVMVWLGTTALNRTVAC